MLNLRNFIPLIFFFLLYLLLQILKLTLFLIYLFQLKEYRFDRLKAHFSTVSGKRHIWEYLNILKWRDVHRPQFTLRIWLMLVMIFLIQYNFFFYALRFSFRNFKTLPANILFSLGFTLILLNFITPLAALITLWTSSLITLPFKKLLVYLATLKIKKTKNLLVIGITGSYGKTAVKEILSLALADFFKVLKTHLNCNTEIGIARVILTRLQKSHEVFIVEIGAYKKGEITTISKMVKPKIGIITGINEQHMALFGTIADTQWAKYELIKSLPKDGLALFNANNYYSQRLFKATAGVAKRLYGHKKMRVKMQVYSFWHLENAMPCLLIADYLGIPRSKILLSLNKIKKLEWGIKTKLGIHKTKVINDSYSANPTGFLTALGMLKRTPAKNKILVTPGIIELGKAEEFVHRNIGKKASTICSKIFLTKPDFVKFIKKGTGKAKDENFIEVVEDEITLFEKLKPFLGKDTAILLEGRVPSFIVSQLKLQK